MSHKREARFPEYSLNAPDLSIPVVKDVAKVCFKCQECREAKNFAEHCSMKNDHLNIICYLKKI